MENGDKVSGETSVELMNGNVYDTYDGWQEFLKRSSNLMTRIMSGGGAKSTFKVSFAFRVQFSKHAKHGGNRSVGFTKKQIVYELSCVR